MGQHPLGKLHQSHRAGPRVVRGCDLLEASALIHHQTCRSHVAVSNGLHLCDQKGQVASACLARSNQQL